MKSVMGIHRSRRVRFLMSAAAVAVCAIVFAAALASSSVKRRTSTLGSAEPSSARVVLGVEGMICDSCRYQKLDSGGRGVNANGLIHGCGLLDPPHHLPRG